VPYKRTVIVLFPFCEDRVPIARFQCREQTRTFSLLPYQLVPYHLYTVESMLLAVLVWCEIHKEEDGGASTALAELHNDCRVTPWLLRNWLGVVVMGLRGGHPTLREWYDLSGIHSGDNLSGMLHEVYSYFQSFGSRGPPSRLVLKAVVKRYSQVTGRHLLGIPSQDRGRSSAE
jgi:hypothetical protein